MLLHEDWISRTSRQCVTHPFCIEHTCTLGHALWLVVRNKVVSSSVLVVVCINPKLQVCLFSVACVYKLGRFILGCIMILIEQAVHVVHASFLLTLIIALRIALNDCIECHVCFKLGMWSIMTFPITLRIMCIE